MAPENPSSDSTRAETHGGKSVALIVEDTDDLRSLFAEELARVGFTVVQASDGQDAIEQAHRFAPHAILLDLMLPGVNGFSVARFLRADAGTRDAAIVAVTALASETMRVSAIEAGCDLLIRKPVVASEVVGELVRVLEQRRAPRGVVGRDGVGGESQSA